MATLSYGPLLPDTPHCTPNAALFVTPFTAPHDPFDISAATPSNNTYHDSFDYSSVDTLKLFSIDPSPAPINNHFDTSEATASATYHPATPPDIPYAALASIPSVAPPKTPYVTLSTASTGVPPKNSYAATSVPYST